MPWGYYEGIGWLGPSYKSFKKHPVWGANPLASLALYARPPTLSSDSHHCTTVPPTPSAGWDDFWDDLRWFISSPNMGLGKSSQASPFKGRGLPQAEGFLIRSEPVPMLYTASMPHGSKPSAAVMELWFDFPPSLNPAKVVMIGMIFCSIS